VLNTESEYYLHSNLNRRKWEKPTPTWTKKRFLRRTECLCGYVIALPHPPKAIPRSRFAIAPPISQKAIPRSRFAIAPPISQKAIPRSRFAIALPHPQQRLLGRASLSPSHIPQKRTDKLVLALSLLLPSFPKLSLG
jgi:hypothetical protein